MQHVWSHVTQPRKQYRNVWSQVTQPSKQYHTHVYCLKSLGARQIAQALQVLQDSLGTLANTSSYALKHFNGSNLRAQTRLHSHALRVKDNRRAVMK